MTIKTRVSALALAAATVTAALAPAEARPHQNIAPGEIAHARLVPFHSASRWTTGAHRVFTGQFQQRQQLDMNQLQPGLGRGIKASTNAWHCDASAGDPVCTQQ
jgi:hypothetical protein